MKHLTRAVLLSGSVSVLAIALSAGGVREAQAQVAGHTYGFNIPSKPLLAALANFTAVTGIQVVRPSAERISGRSQAISGQYSADTALRAILAGSGLIYEFAGPRTVTVHHTGETASFATGSGDAVVLEPIEVAGAGGGSQAFAGVDKVEITQQDLERSNPTDLQDVFAGEPGVSVGSSIPMSQKVYVHGVEETNLAVTIDGSRQNNKIFHHNATNLIDPGLLKAVEIDAGIAPADAGPGALAGSIAYETKDARDLLDPDRSFGGFVKGSYDTNSETFMTGVSGYGVHDGFEVLGYFNFANGENYEDGNGDEVLGSAADFISGIGKLAYEADSGDRFEIGHERIKDDAPRPFRANIGFLTNRPTHIIRDYTIERQNTVFTYTDETPEGWWDPTAVLAYSQTELDVDQPTPAPPYVSNGTTGSLNGKLENRFALAFGSITAGIDFYSDEAKYEDRDYSATERADNVGLYAQARLEPWDRTRLSFGVRGDHQWFEGTGGQKFEDAGFSGNISGEYDIFSFLTAKAGYSHVWAGVPLAENFIANPNWDYGDGPESVTANNYTAGLVARYEGFSFEGGVFRTEIFDARDPSYNPPASGALLSHDLESEGFEIGAGYAWFDGFIRVAYANIDVLIDGEPADSDVGTYIATPIGEIITITGAHTFVDWGLTVGGDVKIVFDYDDVAPGNQPLKGYEVVNLFTEYRPSDAPNLSFRAEINNVFDETYTDRATYGQEFSNVIPLREPGRSFLLSATARF